MHADVNDGDKPIEVVAVELKKENQPESSLRKKILQTPEVAVVLQG
ncbi:MAG TPA: hypothetical protein VN902_01985 [Candidatus Acidoferrales bacterium]|jgi:hypothetical protein|nr:hypothetical protein [Candidatus Acidoferrales bacterium]